MNITTNSTTGNGQPNMQLNTCTKLMFIPSSRHIANTRVRCWRIVLDAVFVFVAKGLWKRLQSQQWGNKVGCRVSVLCALIPDCRLNAMQIA